MESIHDPGESPQLAGHSEQTRVCVMQQAARGMHMFYHYSHLLNIDLVIDWTFSLLFISCCTRGI